MRGSPNFKRGRDGATMRSREPASNSSSKERRQARNEVGTANGPPAVLCDTDGRHPAEVRCPETVNPTGFDAGGVPMLRSRRFEARFFDKAVSRGLQTATRDHRSKTVDKFACRYVRPMSGMGGKRTSRLAGYRCRIGIRIQQLPCLTPDERRRLASRGEALLQRRGTKGDHEPANRSTTLLNLHFRPEKPLAFHDFRRADRER